MRDSLRGLAEQGQKQKGTVQGDGYEVVGVRHRAGFAYSLFCEKKVEGRYVLKQVHVPGLTDIAGFPLELQEYYLVWAGHEAYNPDLDEQFEIPPETLALPMNATGWWGRGGYEGPRNWFAKFGQAEHAEAWAMTQPIPTGNTPVLFRSIAH